MGRIIWTFGLMAGAVLAAMMLITVPFMDELGESSEVIGYTTMILAFMMVYFGIRSYRDNVAGGSITFGRAFRVGALITVIASVCYVATWQVVYYKFAPDFIEKYSAREIEKARASGKTQQEIDVKAADMKKFAELYKNPLVNVAITFIEPLPVGLLITLVAAGVLSRRRGGAVAS